LGHESQGSALLAEAYVLQSTAVARAYEEEVRAASLNLCGVLGRTPANDLVVSGEFESLQPDAAQPDTMRMARETNQTHLALAHVEAARAAVTNARSVLLPRVNMSASITRSGTQIAPQTGSWGIGLNLSYEFFTGGSTLWQVDTALSVQLQSELEYGNVLREQSSLLKTEYIDYSNGAAQRQVALAFLKAARFRSKVARKQYQDGLLDFNDWDVIENDFALRQRAALAGALASSLAQASWERSQGKMLK
jgi:outer membrane protein TolC